MSLIKTIVVTYRIIPSTLNNQLQSPFLRLPAELRNQIYRLAFSNTTIKIFPKDYGSNKPTCPGCRFCDQLRKLRGVSLLLTCRQVYAEANEFLVPNATFDVREVGIDGFVEEYGREKAAQVTAIICGLRQIWMDLWLHESELKWLGASNHPIKALLSLKRVYCVSIFTLGLSHWQISSTRELLDRLTGGRVRGDALDFDMTV